MTKQITPFHYFLFYIFIVLAGCQHKDSILPTTSQATDYEQEENFSPFAVLKTPAGFPEGFETGTKTSYAAANVTLSSGIWNLSNVLIGTTTADKKVGTKALRATGTTAKATMQFDVPGATSVKVSVARYSTHGASYWELWASTNAGSTWTKVGNTQYCTVTALQTVTFTTSYYVPVRFEIRKTTGSSLCLNFDNVQVESPNALRENNLLLGNPSAATNVTTNLNNYLMDKGTHTLSYNSTKGTPNWVSWHLNLAWKGPIPRQNNFASDATLPTGWYKVLSTSYTNSGFDRGHLCPSEDRDSTVAENTATFVMTNMMPQAPNNNQVTWVALENYCRTLMYAGNELYIVSGPMGQGGTGSNGGTTNTIDNGHIVVPAYTWKVIVVVPEGINDVSRITASTRVIAVKMPNTQTVNAQTWGYYRVSVDQLETDLGYNFLSNLSTTLQTSLESVVDNGPTQ
ncbi:MAG: DNA/RNA non-specific endonuclease [Bacteroidia bacterium]